MSSYSQDEALSKMLANWVYIVIGLVSIVCLILSQSLETYSVGISHFLKELGIAGIIALILVFTIEKFTRERHERSADALVEKININLFHAIYKRHIPTEIMTALEKTLFSTGVFRRDHEVYYQLETLPPSEDMKCNKHVKCLATSKYVIENITDSQIKHKIFLTLERPIDQAMEKLCHIESITIGGKPLSREDITCATTKDEAQIIFCYPIDIPARQSVEIKSHATLVKRDTDQEIWSSRVPSDGIKLTVTFPKEMMVRAHALHHESLETVISNDTVTTWNLKHGMFPFQSIVFWWSGKNPLTCPLN